MYVRLVVCGQLGTILGPHVIRDGERPARLCTSCTNTTDPEYGGDLGKRHTPIYWGSSGRRFKSCQPDKEKQALSCEDRSVVRNQC